MEKPEKKRSPGRLLIAVIVVLVGVWIVVSTLMGMTQNSDAAYEPAPVITVSTENPEEKLPSEVGYTWKGLVNDPRSIAIPAIGVDALIQNVGLDQNSQIAVPNNIHIAGWFVDSVRPGEKGLSIIDGHVNGRNSDQGVFKRLPELKSGDRVTITMGDMSTVDYEVVENKSVATVDAPAVLYSQAPGIVEQLNLITCTGNFDNATQTYADRQITILKKL